MNGNHVIQKVVALRQQGDSGCGWSNAALDYGGLPLSLSISASSMGLKFKDHFVDAFVFFVHSIV